MGILHLSDTHAPRRLGADEDGVAARAALAQLLQDCRHLPGIGLVVVSGDVAGDGSAEGYDAVRALVGGFARELRIGQVQLAWLRGLLAEPSPRGSVVVLHHPPIALDRTGQREAGLKDPAALSAALQGSDVQVVLCGHVHTQISGLLGTVAVWVGPAGSDGLPWPHPHRETSPMVNPLGTSGSSSASSTVATAGR